MNDSLSPEARIVLAVVLLLFFGTAVLMTWLDRDDHDRD